MPSFRGRVSDEQAGDLVAYVRAFGPEPPSNQPAPATDFERRFQELEREWNSLQKQLRELPKPGKP
jgi:hypothetical protein